MCRRRQRHRFSAADGIRVGAGATRGAADVVRDAAMTVAAVVDVAIGVDRVALGARAFSVRADHSVTEQCSNSNPLNAIPTYR
jgi:hypothetical protein